MSIPSPLLLSHVLPFRSSEDLSTAPTIGLVDINSNDLIHAQLKLDLDSLTSRINAQEEENEDLGKAIFKEESASRKTVLQAKLKNNKSAVEMARIFLNRALKSLHQKSSMWDKDAREQMEKAEQGDG